MLFNFGNCRRERVGISNRNLLQECVLFETASFHVFARVVLLHALVIIFKTNIVSNSNWVHLNIPYLWQKLYQAEGFQTADNGETASPDINDFIMSAFRQLCCCLEISWRHFFPNPVVV